MSNSEGKKFSWGILGTGGIAQAFAADLSHLPDHTVAAVGSRTLAAASTFAENYPGAIAYGSYQELVESELDAIYIATPHTFHAEHALLALSAGKPVLCEKPFTINASQARAVVDLARSQGIPLLEAIWTRFLPHIHLMQEIIARGDLGEILTVSADHGQYLPRKKHPRLWEPELGGGALLDLGIYSITLAHLVLGSPEKIISDVTKTDEGVDLQTSMIFHYQSGAQAILTCTMANRTAIAATIAGSQARLELDASFYAPTSMRLITRDGAVTEYPNTYIGHGLREEAIEFARMVRDGEIESPLMPHSRSIEIMELMDSVRREHGVIYPGE
jgi:predicted dehydrogenase